MPSNLSSSFLSVDAGMSLMVRIFSSLGLIPSLCKFVTNQGHLLDFEDTFSLV